MVGNAFSRALRWACGAALAASAVLCAPGASAKGAKSAVFIPEKPTEKSQTQKTVQERGGVNPCNTKEPSPGVYEGWNRAPSVGQMIMPARGGVTKDGRFDLVIHFHGHEPMRKEFVQVMDGAVLVGITLGIGSGAYHQTFGAPHAFKDLVASVEDEVAKQRGLKSAKARKIALTAWSAGYGAVSEILKQQLGKDKVDSVILLDGLHVSYNADGSLVRAGLEPFIEFAKRAKAGKRFMFVSHSSIIPPGYASTTETVNALIHALGGKPKSAKPRKSDPMGLELNAKFDSGNFHARGYDGNDKMDHCAHIGLARDVLKAHIKPRWKTPKGQKAKAVVKAADKPKPKSSDKPKAGAKKTPKDKPKAETPSAKAKPKGGASKKKSDKKRSATASR